MVYLLAFQYEFSAMSEKSLFWHKEYRTKIASSFTELFTDAEVQRKFRNYFNYGYDKGTDGR